MPINSLFPILFNFHTVEDETNIAGAQPRGTNGGEHVRGSGWRRPSPRRSAGIAPAHQRVSFSMTPSSDMKAKEEGLHPRLLFLYGLITSSFNASRDALDPVLTDLGIYQPIATDEMGRPKSPDHVVDNFARLSSGERFPHVGAAWLPPLTWGMRTSTPSSSCPSLRLDGLPLRRSQLACTSSSCMTRCPLIPNKTSL